MTSVSTNSFIQLSPIHFEHDPVQYVAPSWDDLYAMVYAISEQVRAAEQTFDTIVTLAKGGWSMTCSLADLLELREVVSVGVRFYTGVNQRLSLPEIYQDIPTVVRGQRVLLFDDVADTGESLAFVTKYLLDRGATVVETATLLRKSHSKIKPDYCGGVSDVWIVFPHELSETTRMLAGKWAKQGVAKKEIIDRLNRLGFSPERVEPFLPLITQ